jgi:hypothetical protein
MKIRGGEKLEIVGDSKFKFEEVTYGSTEDGRRRY